MHQEFSIVFEVKLDIVKKSRIFHTPSAFNAQTEGRFGTISCVKNAKWFGYKFERLADTFCRFETSVTATIAEMKI